jgi:hypothetical protein
MTSEEQARYSYIICLRKTRWSTLAANLTNQWILWDEWNTKAYFLGVLLDEVFGPRDSSRLT